MSNFKKIETEKEYQESLDRVEELVDQDINPDSKAGAELYVLTLIIEEYERQTFPNTAKEIQITKELRETNRLMAEKHHLRGIKTYLQEARYGLKHHTPEMSLCIAMEQMYIIHKRELNKRLVKANMPKITR